MPDDPTWIKQPLGRGSTGLAVQPGSGLPGVAFLLTVTRVRGTRVNEQVAVAGIALSTEERAALITALGGTP